VQPPQPTPCCASTNTHTHPTHTLPNAEDAAASQFDEKARSERQFFAYASTAYRFFLAGDDGRAAAADDEMLGQFRERQAGLLSSNAGLNQVGLLGWL
jgi:hypothetical protein